MLACADLEARMLQASLQGNDYSCKPPFTEPCAQSCDYERQTPTVTGGPDCAALRMSLQAFVDLAAYEQRLVLRPHPQLRQRLLLLYAAHEVQCSAQRWCTRPELFSSMVWYAAGKAGTVAVETPGAHRGGRSQLLQHLALITARRLIRGSGCAVSEVFLHELCEHYKVYVCTWESNTCVEHVLLENVRQIVAATRAYGAEDQLRDVVLQLLRVFFARDPLTGDSLVPLLEYHLVVPAGIGHTLPVRKPTSPFADIRSEQQQRMVREFLRDAGAVLQGADAGPNAGSAT